MRSSNESRDTASLSDFIIDKQYFVLYNFFSY